MTTVSTLRWTGSNIAECQAFAPSRFRGPFENHDDGVQIYHDPHARAYLESEREWVPFAVGGSLVKVDGEILDVTDRVDPKVSPKIPVEPGWYFNTAGWLRLVDHTGHWTRPDGTDVADEDVLRESPYSRIFTMTDLGDFAAEIRRSTTIGIEQAVAAALANLPLEQLTSEQRQARAELTALMQRVILAIRGGR